MAKSRAAIRTVKILEMIANEKRGVTLSDLATGLDIPITSVSDIIKALLDLEMVDIIDERSKVYGIGARAYYIGNAYLANTDLIEKAKPIIEELGQMLNKTIFLGKEVNEKITYIYKYEPSASIISTCPIGSRTPLYCTSLGKCFLAHDKELMERMRDKTFERKTRFTITDHDALEKELERVRDLGYAIDDREQNELLHCVGAPIYDHNGRVVAALSISGVYSEGLDVEYEGNLIRDRALQISKKLGFVVDQVKSAV